MRHHQHVVLDNLQQRPDARLRVLRRGGEAFHEGSLHVRSHGCVYLSASNAAWVFGFLNIGDKVRVVR